LQQLPAAIPGEVVDDLALAVSEAVTTAILCPATCSRSKAAVGVQGGWIEATICDRAAPASRIAPLTSPCGVGGG
jgi:hypothetical protein